MFAGFLMGKGLDLVPCKTVPLEVSANADVVHSGNFADVIDLVSHLCEGGARLGV